MAQIYRARKVKVSQYVVLIKFNIQDLTVKIYVKEAVRSLKDFSGQRTYIYTYTVL